ncbi:hypothetical protein LS81_003200, partial [Helicobacter trogontum]
MGQWISSKEFLVLKNFTLQKDKNVLYQKVKRANDKQKMFITLNKQYFTFTYTNGIGRGGKVLQIWSEPFKSEAEAEAFLHNYRVDMLEKMAKHTFGVSNEITTNATHTLHALNDMSSGAVVSGGVNDTLA